MNVEELKKSGRIIFEAVMGSRAYGTNLPDSDFDVRGLFSNPDREYLGLQEPPGHIKTPQSEFEYFSLRRFFELARTANPTVLELLWAPSDCVRMHSPIMGMLVRNRRLFISKKCYHSFSGYSFDQIRKAKGQNKMANNPGLAVMPKKEDFCKVIPSCMFDTYCLSTAGKMPARPIPIAELPEIDLAMHHCAALEHVPDTYRLYYYGDKNPKGVFRGDDMLACESIPIEDEVPRFVGLLVYNRNEFDKAVKQHQRYIEWMTNRNEERWTDKDGVPLDFNQKNMMHCMRLLMSGENILTHGEPIIRFEGEQREHLMRIRTGQIPYEDLMAEAEARMKTLEELYKTSSIPDSVDHAAIERLYRKLTRWQRVWRFLDLF